MPEPPGPSRRAGAAMPLDDVLLEDLPNGPSSLLRLRDSVRKIRVEVEPIIRSSEKLPHSMQVDLRAIEIDLRGIEIAIDDVVTADEFKNVSEKIERLLNIIIPFNKSLSAVESTER